jgi:GTP-binding protein EngB required for normal cell division
VSGVISGVRGLIGRGGDVGAKVDGLQRAAAAARGRLDDAVVDVAEQVVARASQRLRLSADHTVVALAGATGSGKSSLFNALAGLDLAEVGVRRPTTSWATACTWGIDGSGELLDWLGIPRRHQIARESMLDGALDDTSLHGLVLLDLPDHDSTEVSHHVEVDRLVAMADLLVWVLDPQKYADAAVHDRYLKPLSHHAEIVLVVLNHADVLPPGDLERTRTDVERLLEQDGLGSVQVLATSARTGQGVDRLRRLLVERVGAKRASRARLMADVENAAAALAEQTGRARPRDVDASSRGDLVDAFADAAGVPVVVDAVQRATAVRARRATGWPVTAWLSRLRPDPLKRLHLDLGPSGRELTAVSRASLPQPSRVQRARVDQAVRRVVDQTAGGLPRAWAAAVRRASVSRLEDVSDALDRAVVPTDLGVGTTPRWWRAVQALQWLLFVVAVAGGLWLLALFGFAYLRLPEPPTPQWRGFDAPTLMLVGGAVSGLLVALLCRVLAALSAGHRGVVAHRRLRAGISEVVETMVLEPIVVELDAYRECREGIAAALRR